MTKFPTLDEVVAIHFRVTEKTGGSQGVRDWDLLSSALGRPQATFGGEDLYPDIFENTIVFANSILPKEYIITVFPFNSSSN